VKPTAAHTGYSSQPDLQGRAAGRVAIRLCRLAQLATDADFAHAAAPTPHRRTCPCNSYKSGPASRSWPYRADSFPQHGPATPKTARALGAIRAAHADIQICSVIWADRLVRATLVGITARWPCHRIARTDSVVTPCRAQYNDTDAIRWPRTHQPLLDRGGRTETGKVPRGRATTPRQRCPLSSTGQGADPHHLARTPTTSPLCFGLRPPTRCSPSTSRAGAARADQSREIHPIRRRNIQPADLLVRAPRARRTVEVNVVV